MSEQQTTEQKVRGIISEELGLDLDEVTLESTVESLEADSLDTVECIMRLEEELGIEIPDEDAEKFTNVKAIVDYIDTRT